MYQIFVDDILWEDSDGTTEFSYFELSSVVEDLEAKGYLDISWTKV